MMRVPPLHHRRMTDGALPDSHSSRIAGTVSGFDRLLFRGTLRSISFVNGMDRFLASQRVLYKDFAAFAAPLTARVRTHAAELAQQTGRPLEYLRSSSISKDAPRTRDPPARCDRGGAGLHFLVRRVVHTLTARGDLAAKRLRLVREQRPCVFLGFHSSTGTSCLMHIRSKHGRRSRFGLCQRPRILSRQLTAAGLPFYRMTTP